MWTRLGQMVTQGGLKKSLKIVMVCADSVTHVHGQLADLKATLQGMVPADNHAIVGGHGTD